MVYFGERRFKSAQPGVTSREKSRIVVPSVLLLILVLVILAQQWGNEEPSVPIRAAGRSELAQPGSGSPVVPVAPGAIGSTGQESQPTDAQPTDSNVAGARVSETIEIPAYDTLVEPAPFEELPGLLTVVRDAEIADPGPAEEAGLIYLFHRFRAGVDVPVADLGVAWEELPVYSSTLRGRRTEKAFVLVEEPIPRTLDRGNRAGVLQYYEAFARDEDGHLVRLHFLNKPKILPADSEVEAVVDFLRLHQYQMVRGGRGIVPDWVALEVRKIEPLEFDGGDWSPLLYVMGISFGALGVLLIIVLRSKEPDQRRRRSRPGRAPRAGAQAPPDPGTS